MRRPTFLATGHDQARTDALTPQFRGRQFASSASPENIGPPVADRIYFGKLKPRLEGLFFGSRAPHPARQNVSMKGPRRARVWLIGLGLGALANGITCAEVHVAASSWPDTFAVRVEALALLQTLNADLLSHDSATATLARWCELHKMAPDPHIIAVRLRGAAKTPTAAQRVELGVSTTQTVRYRHVELMCGSLVLSEADNWYVPARLTAQMNHLLETTDTPFGVIVHALHFQRHTLSARLLWTPLTPGWEMKSILAEQATGNLPVPAEVLEHRAVLTLPSGTPFSEVVEVYTGNVLAFPAPQVPTQQR